MELLVDIVVSVVSWRAGNKNDVARGSRGDCRSKVIKLGHRARIVVHRVNRLRLELGPT
jgi:hypothetical protein